MPLYRVIARERAIVKHEYEIEADSDQQARQFVESGFPDGDWPESVSHEIDEYTGDIHVQEVTAIAVRPEEKE